MGHRVSGSDLRDTSTLERLRAEGVTVGVGHDATNVPADLQLMAVSTAITTLKSTDPAYWQDPEPYFNTQYRILQSRGLAPCSVTRCSLVT